MSDIIGPAAAKTALNTLIAQISSSLAAAKTAGDAAYGAAIDAAQRDLEAFFKSTRPGDDTDNVEVAAVRAIDQIAFDLFMKLSVDQLEANADQLEEGAAKLETLGQALDAAANANVRSAASIALKPVKDAIDSMTAIVGSVKSLKANLSSADPDEAQVITEIEKLVAQFETLKAAVTTADV